MSHDNLNKRNWSRPISFSAVSTGPARSLRALGPDDDTSGNHSYGPQPGNRTARLSENISSWLLVATIAWAPFPLGSNRPWAWSLLVLLIVLSWISWIPSALVKLDDTGRAARKVAVPGLIMCAVLVWASLQTVSWTPASLHNSIWDVIPDAPGAISMNPFETATEVMKLLSYVSAGWLAYVLARDHGIARRFFVAIAVIGFAYAAYGLFLSAVHGGQVTFFEGTSPPYGRDVTSAFVSKNSFATFDGMALIVCLLLVVDRGRETVISTRGPRRLAVTTLQYVLGRGAFPILGAIVLFVALVASDSRAGLLATLVALLVLFIYSLIVGAKRGTARLAIAVGAVAFVFMGFLFLVNGQPLQNRIDELIQTRGSEELRPVMWTAAQRAIEDHTYTGTGLGTFRDSYNLYADRFDPFIFDRVHNDYLELSLGVGLPAAIAWIVAFVWLVGLCGVGVVRRRRRRHFALAAIGTSVLVAVHSAFDFSLQMPADALLYASVLGIGVAQAAGGRTREPGGHDRHRMLLDVNGSAS